MTAATISETLKSAIERMDLEEIAKHQLTKVQRLRCACKLQKAYGVGRGFRTDIKMKPGEKIRSRARAAKAFGVSEGLINSMRFVDESGDKTLIDAVEAGIISISAAAEKVKKTRALGVER